MQILRPLFALALVLGTSFGFARYAPRVERDMASAAIHFLALLGDEQRAAATFPFEGDERTTWHFVPRDYPGVRWGSLDMNQQIAARRLIQSVMGYRGELQVYGVRALDAVLRELESTPERVATHRDSGRYFIAVLGDPGTPAPWGWRVQGHHLSIHFSSIDDSISVTPFFLGASPADAHSKHYNGRLLGLEMAQALALYELLDDTQRAACTLDIEQPRDVILGPGRGGAFDERVGLPAVDMTETQVLALEALVMTYVDRLRPELAGPIRQRIRDEMKDTSFAWIGARSLDGPHYYRVHAPSYAIEYATQAGAPNHVHTVWRDFSGDFGADLLREHLEREHDK